MDAEEIVRALAASDWVYDHICCFFCGASVVYDSESNVTGAPHEDDCVYAAAVRWVREHPLP